MLKGFFFSFYKLHLVVTFSARKTVPARKTMSINHVYKTKQNIFAYLSVPLFVGSLPVLFFVFVSSYGQNKVSN